LPEGHFYCTEKSCQSLKEALMKMMKFANHLTKDRNAHPSSGVGIKVPDAESYTGLPGAG
jgi:hypothetical protein